jgi:hypothetical protein
MRAHTADANVQYIGCAAVASLARKHPANQAAIASAGGVEAVVGAMRAHTADANVQRCAVAAVQWLRSKR